MIISSISELQNFISTNLEKIAKPRQILLLEGEMGSGKTEFVKQLVKLLGGEIATSPSFAIHNSYPIKKSVEKLSVEHLDLYRIESEDELQSVGFWDLFAEDSSLVVIEWAERIDAKRLPLNWQKIKIQFRVIDQNRREILSGGL